VACIRAQVRKLIAPSNRIILVVEEFIDAQSDSASYARNYLLDLIKVCFFFFFLLLLPPFNALTLRLSCVQEYDPAFSRTVFAYSKFYHLMKHFNTPEVRMNRPSLRELASVLTQAIEHIHAHTQEISKQISLRPHNSFFISLFNESVRSKLTNKEDYQKKVMNCYYRDLMILEKLGYDKR
jgi:hypothetical protein